MENSKNKNDIFYKYIIPILLSIIVILLIAIVLLVLGNKKDYNLDNINDNTINDNGTNIDNSTNNNYISKQEALNISLNNIGITQDSILDLDIELDYKYGKTVYEISFNYKKFEYEYYIDAINGEIIHSFKELD